MGNFLFDDKLSEISKKLKRKFAMAASARVCSSVCDSVFENIGTTSSLVSQAVLENTLDLRTTSSLVDLYEIQEETCTQEQ